MYLEPEEKKGNTQVADFSNVVLYKDETSSLDSLRSTTEEMSTQHTLSEHSSLREYRTRPEMSIVAKAAHAYLQS